MAEKATFGAGCFWGVESAFRQVEGVSNVTCGYAGGHTEDPTYEQVCAKTTGHAEVVEVEFDPAVVPYDRLVDVFFAIHDPTQLNRQGPDVGDQYRTVIFTHNPQQETLAREAVAKLEASGKFHRPVVTQIEPAPTFYPAEDYHQNYFAKRGLKNTCHIPLH